VDQNETGTVDKDFDLLRVSPREGVKTVAVSSSSEDVRDGSDTGSEQTSYPLFPHRLLDRTSGDDITPKGKENGDLVLHKHDAWAELRDTQFRPSPDRARSRSPSVLDEWLEQEEHAKRIEENLTFTGYEGKGRGTKREGRDFETVEPLPSKAKSLSHYEAKQSDHRNTQLTSGRRAVMLDTGSCGNLAGSKWCINSTKAAMSSGLEVRSFQRHKPLGVSGVGKGAEVCKHDAALPAVLKTQDGSYLRATYTTPVVPSSDLPALLGLDTLKRLRGVYDATTNKLHLLGKAGLEEDKLPPGTTTIQCEYGPSGHVMIPIDYYEEGKKEMGGIETSPLNMHILPSNTSQSSNARTIVHPSLAHLPPGQDRTGEVDLTGDTQVQG